MTEEFEERLVGSWARNAESWTEAVRAERIESRRLVTDRSIVDAVLACGGRKVLDVGCGEGWLARRLSAEGREVVGFDGSAALVERAREMGGGSFVVLSYEGFAEEPDHVGRDHDVAVANFSLLAERVADLLSALRRVVSPHGRLVIQTVHAVSVEGRPSEDGWREETFGPLAPLEFSAMPWYFRTAASWEDELERTGWRIVRRHAPIDPRTGAEASLILVAEPRSSSPS